MYLRIEVDSAIVRAPWVTTWKENISVNVLQILLFAPWVTTWWQSLLCKVYQPLQLQKWEIIIIISYWQFLERKSRFFPVLTSANISQVTEIVSQASVWNNNFASLPEQVEILFLVGDFGGLQKKNGGPVVILTKWDNPFPGKIRAQDDHTADKLCNL